MKVFENLPRTTGARSQGRNGMHNVKLDIGDVKSIKCGIYLYSPDVDYGEDVLQQVELLGGLRERLKPVLPTKGKIKGTLDSKVFIPPSNGDELEKLRAALKNDIERPFMTYYFAGNKLPELLRDHSQLFKDVENELV